MAAGRKIIAGAFIGIALVLGAVFYQQIEFPVGLEPYLQASYYGQFGPLALCVELFIAGYYLLRAHKKANFSLALFGFTALLDPLLTRLGILSTQLPTHALIIFVLCGIVALWLAFTNAYQTGRISALWAVLSFLSGLAIELWFNS